MAKTYTVSGHHLSEVISAVQKLIRQGQEKEALYWCFELVPRYERYLWRRLLVIANEDIGIGNPVVLWAIPALRHQFFEFRSDGRNGTARLILANAILLLCRSPKTRIADHMQRVVSQLYVDQVNAPEIPDFAFDKHTNKGKAMGRGARHWLEEGCILIPEADVSDDYKEQAEQLWLEEKTDAPEWGRRPGGMNGPLDLPPGTEEGPPKRSGYQPKMKLQ